MVVQHCSLSMHPVWTHPQPASYPGADIGDRGLSSVVPPIEGYLAVTRLNPTPQGR